MVKLEQKNILIAHKKCDTLLWFSRTEIGICPEVDI